MPSLTNVYSQPKRVRVIHWRDAEAAPLIAAVRSHGFEPENLADSNGAAVARAIGASMPDAILIDLSRLPSQGREIGVWLRNRKSTRGIPLVFVNGQPEKTEKIRAVIPDALYASPDDLCSVLKSACAGRVADPIIPPSPMERFKGKTAAQKLGIVAASTVAVMDAPRDWAAVLGEVPDGVEIREDPEAVQDVTLWFIRDSAAMLAAVRRMRAIAAKTKLWVIWPKGKANLFREGSIREMGIENGLVDYKICSVNEHWSGMLFARKKA